MVKSMKSQDSGATPESHPWAAALGQSRQATADQEIARQTAAATDAARLRTAVERHASPFLQRLAATIEGSLQAFNGALEHAAVTASRSEDTGVTIVRSTGLDGYYWRLMPTPAVRQPGPDLPADADYGATLTHMGRRRETRHFRLEVDELGALVLMINGQPHTPESAIETLLSPWLAEVPLA